MKTIKVKMYFPANGIKKPMTYNLIKDYDLRVNILHADISLNKTGKLIADITGEEDNIQKGLDFIKREGVEYKIFDSRVIWNEEKCVHCGACTAVCPSGALTIGKDKWKLNFYSEKCLVCGLCVRACPLGVITLKD